MHPVAAAVAVGFATLLRRSLARSLAHLRSPCEGAAATTVAPPLRRTTPKGALLVAAVDRYYCRREPYLDFQRQCKSIMAASVAIVACTMAVAIESTMVATIEHQNFDCQSKGLFRSSGTIIMANIDLGQHCSTSLLRSSPMVQGALAFRHLVILLATAAASYTLEQFDHVSIVYCFLICKKID